MRPPFLKMPKEPKPKSPVKSERATSRCSSGRVVYPFTAIVGQEAMKLALRSPVDVVLTDAVMPHMSGQELARFMRTTPKLSQIPIVLLTGQENGQAMAPAEELVDAFLTKPVKIEELKSCLVELLSRA